jgi:amidohydrolase
MATDDGSAGFADPTLSQALELYRELHRHPELSGQESQTAARLVSWLEDDRFDVRTGVGGHGFIATLTRGDGPHVAMRAELDALPVAERTGLPYASSDVDAEGHVPVMHACGHDLHASAVVGAARMLSRPDSAWSGTLSVIGQPAEETLTGARAMIEDGLYAGPSGAPDVVLAQHCAPLPTGFIAHAPGAVFAASVTLRVTVYGGGGHAGAPQLSVDPVVAAAAIVMRLQTVVARETGPAEPIVVTVGSMHAGISNNVLPETATLEITVRAMLEVSLDRVVEAVKRVVRAECQASACPREPAIELTAQSPVTWSDRAPAARVRAAHVEAFGSSRIVSWVPSMATEDVGLFGPAGLALHGSKGAALCYWILGVTDPSRWNAVDGDAMTRLAAQPPNHSPAFAPDPDALGVGITAMVSAALACLSRDQQLPSAGAGP